MRDVVGAEGENASSHRWLEAFLFWRFKALSPYRGESSERAVSRHESFETTSLSTFEALNKS